MLLRSYQDLVKINLAVENGSIAQARSTHTPATSWSHPAFVPASHISTCVAPPAGPMCIVCTTAQMTALVAAFDAAKAGTGRLHLWGLLSDGGVHSHQNPNPLTSHLSPSPSPLPPLLATHHSTFTLTLPTSSTGVHSHQNHLYALVAAAKAAGVPRTLLHVCTDGRDTPPTSAGGYMASLEKRLAELGYGEISSITGRYYAMDRDKR